MSRAKLATIISTVLWLLSIALAFLIHAGQPLIWLPDFLLLAGFVPLLWLWRIPVLTLLFGISNFAIGAFILLLASFEPGTFPKESLPMLDHLTTMHCWQAWMAVGIVTSLWGLVTLVMQIVSWLKKKRELSAK